MCTLFFLLMLNIIQFRNKYNVCMLKNAVNKERNQR